MLNLPAKLLSIIGVTTILLLSSIQSAQAINAPDFSLPGNNNESISLSKYRGKVVYVDFWASWCTPCKQSFPWMNDVQNRYRSQGLEVVAINLDADRSEASKFLSKVKADFTIAYDPSGKTAEKYDLKVMPSSYLINRKGELIHLHRGFKTSDSQKIEMEIVEALKQQ